MNEIWRVLKISYKKTTMNRAVEFVTLYLSSIHSRGISYYEWTEDSAKSLDFHEEEARDVACIIASTSGVRIVAVPVNHSCQDKPVEKKRDNAARPDNHFHLNQQKPNRLRVAHTFVEHCCPKDF